ncbi:MAG: hypothetical protein J5743_14130 [Victivallales bacterium]|nr:hypothetical protein [Victivallales bacterium]
MDTNVHDESTEYTEETECLADVGHRSDEFVDNMLFSSRRNREGLRLLGGSSRFAQAKITSCGSLKIMVCCLRRLFE